MSTVNSIDYKKYKRFFAFGCSMTDYVWPTWADIIGKHIPEYYNCGASGSGNICISNRIAEMHQRFSFTKEDLIIVMWSSVNREDKYVNGIWECHGNVYQNPVFYNSLPMQFGSEPFYTFGYLRKYADYRGFLVRDLGLISLTYYFLNSLESDFCMLNMSPFVKETRMCNEFKSQEDLKLKTDDVVNLHNQVLKNIKPDFLTLMYNGVWPKTPLKVSKSKKKTDVVMDSHPLPIDHLKYLEEVFDNFYVNKKVKDFIESETEKITSFKRTRFEFDCGNNLKEMLWKKESKSYNLL